MNDPTFKIVKSSFPIFEKFRQNFLKRYFERFVQISTSPSMDANLFWFLIFVSLNSARLSVSQLRIHRRLQHKVQLGGFIKISTKNFLF